MSPWIGPGPDDRDLDDEIVESSGLQPRQHRHLRPALDLEDADRVGPPDHRVGLRIVGRDRREVAAARLVLAQEIEGAAHAAEHAEAEHVDLHELEGVDVVLVPFDHLPVLHRGRLDRHEIVEPVLGQDEAARMLREMARRADQFAGELQRQAQARIVEVEVEVLGLALGSTPSVAPAPDEAGQSRSSRPPARPAPCRLRARRRGRGSRSRRLSAARWRP